VAGTALGGAGGFIHDRQVQRDTAAAHAAALQRENEELRRQIELQRELLELQEQQR
jgi:hypothetical protein